jgi:hypothetical protein
MATTLWCYAPIAFEFVTTGLQLSRTRDSSRVNCIAEEKLDDTIMISIEEDTKADDVDAQKQFYKKCSMYDWSGAVDCTCLVHSSAYILYNESAAQHHVA